MKTKKELSDIHKLANKLNFDDFCKAMQEYSDHQTANLKAVNLKQAELIKFYDTHYSGLGSYKTNKLYRLRNELQSLQSEKEPTAVEMVREAFEPIQRGEEESKHPTNWRDFTMTDDVESQEERIPDAGKTINEPKQTAELRERISNAFTENSSDANNGQMSVITEDSYSDLIDEIIEIFQSQEPKCKECPLKQFYEANTAKIMDKIEQPEISVTDEDVEIAAREAGYGIVAFIEGVKWYRDKIKQNGQ